MISARDNRGRVVVTRAARQAKTFEKRLRLQGLVPIHFPVIRFETLPFQPRRPADYDWLLFTSVNGVSTFFEETQQPDQIQGQTAVAAVGPATAAALEKRGITPGVVPDRFTADHLAAALGDLAGRRILLPRAGQGGAKVVEQLKAKGAIVDDLPLYDTVLNDPPAQAWVELATGWDVATFTSPSTVRNFVELISRPPLQFSHVPFKNRLREGKIACIGPVTRRQAIDLGFEVDIVPDHYTIAALAEEVGKSVWNDSDSSSAL